MNNEIKTAIENGRVVLFIGAGCSTSSQDSKGNNLKSSGQLAEHLAIAAGFTYNNEALSVVYPAVKRQLGAQLLTILQDLYRNTKPSLSYNLLAKFPWARIYTINIDDALDKALHNNSPQNIHICTLRSYVEDRNQLYETLNYIKLNGSSDRLEDGVIFSPREYGEAAANTSLWYQELGVDYFKYNFIFLGTTLNEPVFYQQVERYREVGSTDAPQSYLLVPGATDLQKTAIESYGIEYLDNSLEDFVDWLQKTFSPPPAPLDLAFANQPTLRTLKLETRKNKEEAARDLEGVEAVDRALLAERASNTLTGQIRKFYLGYKPNWHEIADEVPANLEILSTLETAVLNGLKKTNQLIVVYGPAGSGKTTLLMQLAYHLSGTRSERIYFISQPRDNLRAVITRLEEMNTGKYLLFIDRIQSSALDLKKILQESILQKGTIVAAESEKAWTGRIKAKIGDYVGAELRVGTIAEPDANRILSKLEKFGPWTRLGKMKPHERVTDILHNSKRQLLIGLLQTTQGTGFEEIIERDYTGLSDIARKFVLLVGYGTLEHVALRENIISRALRALGVNASFRMLVSDTAGIVRYSDGELLARHPVYMRYLFEGVAESVVIAETIKALLTAFSAYKSPVIQSVSRSEGQVFKLLLNHKFLRDNLKRDKELILNIYRSFEKVFERDGQYWLQYGLSLRDFGEHEEAFEKLRTAVEAYPQPFAEHAFALQQLIIAVDSAKRERAYMLLGEAKETLERLDSVIRDADEYPIVTLAELHTRVALKFENIDKAKTIAHEYADRIQSRLSYSHDERLKAAWQLLTNFVIDGIWRKTEYIVSDDRE